MEADPRRIPGRWMSSAELKALRIELRGLRLSVEALEDRVLALEGERSRGEDSEAEKSSVWTEVIAEERVQPPESASVGRPAEDRRQVRQEDVGARLDLARECGRFLARALRGDYRGGSGRDRLRVGSVVYVVLATYSGEQCSPPRVVADFNEVKRICKSGPHCGRSVFLGFASWWEAKEGLQAAGFEWPLRD